MLKKLFLTIFLLTVSVAASPAQNNPEQAILNARDRFFDIKTRSIEIERMKRDANKQPVSEDFTLKFPEIKEDFEQIQKINSDILQLTIKTPVNYASVAKFASKINQRAVRLKSNLFPAEPKQKNDAPNKKQIVVGTQDIKTLLNVLDESINSFVHNSIFQNINLVNLEDTLKAQKDLSAIINVSNAIKLITKN
jgi:hypothetical protein